jgi:hypothetical protein
LLVAYNAAGKPERIELQGDGYLQVFYGAANRLDRVEFYDAEDNPTSASNDMAMTITSTFNDLLEITNGAELKIDTDYTDVRQGI